jgi:uncharacterized protein YaaQ
MPHYVADSGTAAVSQNVEMCIKTKEHTKQSEHDMMYPLGSEFDMEHQVVAYKVDMQLSAGSVILLDVE